MGGDFRLRFRGAWYFQSGMCCELWVFRATGVGLSVVGFMVGGAVDVFFKLGWGRGCLVKIKGA